MAYIIDSLQSLVRMLNTKLTHLRNVKEKGEMLILPLPLARLTPVPTVYDVLNGAMRFQARRVDDGIFEEAVGSFSMPVQSSVDDVLADLAAGAGALSSTLLDAIAAAEVDPTLLSGPAPTKLNLPMVGTIYVNKQIMAQKLGVPITSDKFSTFACLHVTVKDRLGDAGEMREFLVIVRGKAPSRMFRQTQGKDVLAERFGSMKLDAEEGFDRPFTLEMPDLDSGWQLAFHPSFSDWLGHLCGGYGYIISKRAEGGIELF